MTPPAHMNQSAVVVALQALGERLALDAPELEQVEIIVIGGAAGMLAGMLPPERTTSDCDVLHVDPPDATAAVMAAARMVADQIGLSEQWLNPGGMPWVGGLPPGWRDRVRRVLQSGPLTVASVGRLDLVVLKLLAGRPQDIEDLEALRLVPAELDAVRAHLDGWSDDSWPRGVVDEAIALLDALAESVASRRALRAHGASEEAAHGAA